MVEDVGLLVGAAVGELIGLSDGSGVGGRLGLEPSVGVIANGTSVGASLG